MATEIGTLVIQMQADVARLRKDMDEAKGVVNRGMRGIEDAADKARTAIGAIGIGLSVGAFVNQIRSTVDFADHLNDLSQQIGVSVRDLTTWKLAADQSGTSLDAVGAGVRKFSTFIVEHNDRLKAAGITAKDTNGKLLQLADVFQALPDGAEKTALAVALFGKAGAELIPMLNGGSAALREQMEKSKSLADLYDRLAPGADKLNDQIAILKTYSEAAGVSLASSLVPSLNDVVNNFIKAREAGLGFFESLTGFGVRGLNETVSEAKKSAGQHIKELMADRDVQQQIIDSDPAYKTSYDDAAAQERIRELNKKLAYYRALQAETVNQADYSNEGVRGKLGMTPYEAEQIRKKILEDKLNAETAARAYDNYMKSLREKIALEQAQFDNAGPLNESQKLRVDLESRFAELLLSSNPLKRAAAQTEIDRLVALREANAAEADHIKWVQAGEKAQTDRMRAVEDAIATERQQLDTYGLSRSQIERLNIARKEEQRDMEALHNTSSPLQLAALAFIP